MDLVKYLICTAKNWTSIHKSLLERAIAKIINTMFMNKLTPQMKVRCFGNCFEKIGELSTCYWNVLLESKDTKFLVIYNMVIIREVLH